jgi:hypothetical protein
MGRNGEIKLGSVLFNALKTWCYVFIFVYMVRWLEFIRVSNSTGYTCCTRILEDIQ